MEEGYTNSMTPESNDSFSALTKKYPHLVDFLKYLWGYLIFVFSFPFIISFFEGQGIPLGEYISTKWLYIFISIAIWIEYLTEEIWKTSNNLLEDIAYAILISLVLTPYFYWVNSPFLTMVLAKAGSMKAFVLLIKGWYLVLQIVISLLFIGQILKCLNLLGVKNVFKVFWEGFLALKDLVVFLFKNIKIGLLFILKPFIIFFKNAGEASKNMGGNVASYDQWISVEEEKSLQEKEREQLITNMLKNENEVNNETIGFDSLFNGQTEGEKTNTITTPQEENNPFSPLQTDSFLNNQQEEINPFLSQQATPIEEVNTAWTLDQFLNTEEQPLQEQHNMALNESDLFWNIFSEDESIQGDNQELISTLDDNLLENDYIKTESIEEPIPAVVNQSTEINQEEKITKKEPFLRHFEKEWNLNAYFKTGFFDIDSAISDPDKNKILIFLESW